MILLNELSQELVVFVWMGGTRIVMGYAKPVTTHVINVQVEAQQDVQLACLRIKELHYQQQLAAPVMMVITIKISPFVIIASHYVQLVMGEQILIVKLASLVNIEWLQQMVLASAIPIILMMNQISANHVILAVHHVVPHLRIV